MVFECVWCGVCGVARCVWFVNMRCVVCVCVCVVCVVLRL